MLVLWVCAVIHHKSQAAERKADKLADTKAKQAIKLQIEADKKERAEKFAREKAIRNGTDVNQPSVPAPASTNQNSASSTAAITRLQLKFSNGPVMTLSLPSESSEFNDYSCFTK